MPFIFLAQSNEFLLECLFPSFVNDEAMSSELAGYFFLAIDKKDTALKYFTRAHEKYQVWGAFAKCDALFEFIQTELDSIYSGGANSVLDTEGMPVTPLLGFGGVRKTRRNTDE